LPKLPEFVLDTSVALKWFLLREEADRDRALALQRAFLDGRVMLRAPELLVIELANVLVTGRKFTASQVRSAIVALRNLALQLHPLEWQTLSRAVEVASEKRAAVYDCLFLALAETCDCLLVTADESFLRKARNQPRVFRLSQWPLPD
jgi:predicted nucleic acid-binding protein